MTKLLADRALSSTAPRERIGSTLAVMNAVGFALIIPAISLTTSLWAMQGTWVLWWLLPGPILGLWALRALYDPAGQTDTAMR